MRARDQEQNNTPGDRYFEIRTGDLEPLLFQHVLPARAASILGELHRIEDMGRKESAELDGIPSIARRNASDYGAIGWAIKSLWAHPKYELEAKGSWEEQGIAVCDQLADWGYTSAHLYALYQELLDALVAISVSRPSQAEVQRLRDFGRAGPKVDRSITSSWTSGSGSSETPEPSRELTEKSPEKISRSGLPGGSNLGI